MGDDILACSSRKESFIKVVHVVWTHQRACGTEGRNLQCKPKLGKGKGSRRALNAASTLTD